MLDYLLYALIFALPFGARKLLFQFTPGFHEYETAFFYASDILLLVFLVAVALHKLKSKNEKGKTIVENLKRSRICLTAFILFAGVSVFFAPSHGLALYGFTRLLFAVFFTLAIVYMLRARIVSVEKIFIALAASAVLQSLVAFAQFARQGSMGLRLLGEPALSANAPGIAKFVAGGGRMLRAYGTFPHPNVLGAFLVLGLISLLYLCFSAMSRYLWLRVGGIFLTLLGLLLTFSRAAWLMAVVASIALILYCFARRGLRRRATLLMFVLVASGCSLLAILHPFIFPRAQVIATEPSVVERLEYNTLGLSLIREHPFGVGLGNQVLYSVQNGLYQKLGMTAAWQWEPIHNIYLLIASEIGVAGGLSFIFFVALLLMSNVKYQISNLGIGHFIGNWKLGIRNFSGTALSADVVVLQIMLLSLLALGMVDHFLWTLWPGQLMLWLAIGLVLGLNERDMRP